MIHKIILKIFNYTYSMTVIEYVWVCNNYTIHSKTRVFTNTISSLENVPSWNYDGSSTNQTETTSSEINIVPRALFNDPFKGYNFFMVLCDAYTYKDEPLSDNARYSANIIMENYKSLEPWFGLEQEYFLYKKDEAYPLGFVDGVDPGNHYCGNSLIDTGRIISEEHLKACIDAGITISGSNAEVVTGQWEFQIGPCEGIQQGDHLWMARFLLHRICEKYDVLANFEAKPVENVNGSGCHMNYSTNVMRADEGLNVILSAITKLSNYHNEHMEVYGDGNRERMIGTNETADYSNFKYGIGDRTASIRIGYQTFKDRKGYFEDRRPAASVDPYIITAKMVKTTNL